MITAYVGRPPDAARTLDFARRVLGVECPPMEDTEAVQVMRMLWDCPAVLAELGWESWREMLTAELAKGWHNAQIKFTIVLADASETVRGDLVDDILDGDATMLTRYVGVLEGLVHRHSGWFVARLLARPLPGRAGLSSLAYAMKNLEVPPDVALQLRAWLSPGRAYAPRNIWPAEIVLAGGSVETHREILRDLTASPPEPALVDGAVNTWIHNSPAHVLAAVADGLRSLLTAKGDHVTETRARLEARLAGHDPKARAWLAGVLLDGADSGPAGKAANMIELPVGMLSTEIVEWLITLVETPHTDAALRLARIVGDRARVDDDTLVLLSEALRDVTIRRMRHAVAAHEDSNLVRDLLSLLIRLDMLGPLSRDCVEEIYGVTRSRLPERPGEALDGQSARHSAAVRDMFRLCWTLFPERFSKAEIRELLAELLTVADVISRSKLSAALTGVFERLVRSDPDAFDWLTNDLFPRTDLVPGAHHAIAAAVLTVEDRQPGGRASALRTLSSCPTEVATFLLRELHGRL